MYVGENGEIWECFYRVTKIGIDRELIMGYELLVLWFVPLVLLLFTYISVAVTLVRSIKQTAALREVKGCVLICHST